MNLTSTEQRGAPGVTRGPDVPRSAVEKDEWGNVSAERTPLPLNFEELRGPLQLGPNGLTRDYVNKVYSLLKEVIRLFYDDVEEIDFSRIPLYSDHEAALVGGKAGILDIEAYRALVAAHCPGYEATREHADKLGAEFRRSVERFAEFIIAFRDSASSVENTHFMPAHTALDAASGSSPVDQDATDSFLFNRISLILDLGEIFTGSREEALLFLTEELRERMLGGGE